MKILNKGTIRRTRFKRVILLSQNPGPKTLPQYLNAFSNHSAIVGTPSANSSRPPEKRGNSQHITIRHRSLSPLRGCPNNWVHLRTRKLYKALPSKKTVGGLRSEVRARNLRQDFSRPLELPCRLRYGMWEPYRKSQTVVPTKSVFLSIN